VEFELYHADGRTDMTKLIVAFHNFANTPKQILSHDKDPSALVTEHRNRTVWTAPRTGHRNRTVWTAPRTGHRNRTVWTAPRTEHRNRTVWTAPRTEHRNRTVWTAPRTEHRNKTCYDVLFGACSERWRYLPVASKRCSVTAWTSVDGAPNTNTNKNTFQHRFCLHTQA
jgi:hypothetical protein